MERIYTILLDNGASYQARGSESLDIRRGDMCVVSREFFYDCGRVSAPGAVLEESCGEEMPRIVRKADAQDLQMMESNVGRNAEAMRQAQEQVDYLQLPMKLLNASYSLDGKQLTIQFTADGRVDFRELVKVLSHTMNTRIKLRQIGVRDESAIRGGIAVCGQVLCCCRFLKEFDSINVRMAKDQDLSLTPAAISGVCGRLKCCLKFEHEGYVELEKTMPRRGEWCESAAGCGRVCDRNLLTQEVTLALEGGAQVRCKAADVKPCPPERRPQPGRNNNGGGNNRNPEKRNRPQNGAADNKEKNSENRERNRERRRQRKNGGENDNGGSAEPKA
ncbi:MAG: hypothetical protein IJC73_03265 [Lentisphaeria bacterium]|nr:hypothetical protein [Lentisphaeria bacterium]